MAKFTSDDPRINRNGAPTLQSKVETWFSENPGGSVSKCSRELNISRPTVIKWMPEQIKNQRLQERKATVAEQLPPEPPTKAEQVLQIIKEPGKIRKIVNILKD